MPLLRLPRTALVAAVFLLAAPASAEERAVYDTSIYGAVVGPLDRELTPEDQEKLLAEFDRFTDGLEQLRSRRFAEAAAVLEQVFGTTRWFEAGYDAALARRGAGEVRAALALIEETARIRPDDHGTAALRSVLLQALGRHQDALAVLDVALKTAQAGGLRFEEALVTLNRGSALRQLGRVAEARDTFRRAGKIGAELGRDPVVVASKIGEGRALSTMGDVNGARAAFDAAAGASGDGGTEIAELQLALARSTAASGDRAGARALLTRAVSGLSAMTDPLRKGEGLLDAAGLAGELGDAASSARYLDQAEALLRGTESATARASVRSMRGRRLLEAGDPAGAEKALSEAEKLLATTQVPLTLAETRIALGRAFLEQKKWTEARAALAGADELLRPGAADGLRRGLLVVRSELHRRRGSLANALADVQEALALAERGGDTAARGRLRAERSVLLAALDRVDEAAAEQRRIAPSAWSDLGHRTRARVLLQLAFANVRAGRAEPAEASAREALEQLASATDSTDLRDAAREVVVRVLLDTDRRKDAETFLAEQGLGSGALEDQVKARRALDLFNEGVDAFNSSDYPLAIERFSGVADDETAAPERRAESRRNLVAALLQQGLQQRSDGEPEAAAASFEESAARAEQAELVKDEATARLLVVELLAEHGQFERAEEAAGRAEQAALGADDPAAAAQGWSLIGDAAYETDAPRAAAAYRRALPLMAKTADDSAAALRATTAYNLAVLVSGDDAAEARKLLEQAETQAMRAGDPAFAAEARAALNQLTDD